MLHPVWRLIVVSMLLTGMAAAGGCASRRSLTDADRAELRNQPVIHVVHYATPTPTVQAPKAHVAPYTNIKLHETPTGSEIQENLGGYDPTLDLARRFGGVLTRSAGLKNLRIERDADPLPPLKDAKGFQTRYKNGAVLEVWVERWGFHYVPVDWKTYTLTLSAKARLTRAQDGQVLWSTGSCGYASAGKTFDDRIVLSDLKSNNSKKAQAKFRQAMGQIADNCAQQLLQDYSKTK